MGMNVSKQIDVIHSMARGRRMQWLKWSLVALSVALAIAGLYTRQPPYFMVIVLTVLIASCAHQTAPHVRAASAAVRSGERSEGLVNIEIDRSSDSDTFYATVTANLPGAWRFEFIPLGWTPTAGQTYATIYRLPDVPWPALVAVEGGVMYPRYTPKSASK